MKQIWDKEAESYLEENFLKPDYQAHFEITWKSMGLVKNKSILDVGSGTGLADMYLATKGANVTLLDISNKSLEFSKRIFRKNKINANFVLGDAFDMKFESASFDIVWNSGVIEHFEKDKQILMVKKMWKLVKPGGKLIIQAPNKYDLIFQIASLILKLRKKWAFGEEKDMTISELKNLFEENGIYQTESLAYNPIVGWWFFPFGKEITDKLGLNTLNHHKKLTPFGHVISVCAMK